jgi:hypothetical protein
MKPAIFKPRGQDLKSISGFNSDWADRIALLILVGLAVDILNAFVECKAWRIGLTILANALIAIGVWGELWFLKRARTADDGRVAEANRAAEEAKLETEKLREKHSWRVLSPPAFTELALSLRGPAASVLISYPLGDTETAGFVTQLSTAFRQADWKVGFVASSYSAPLTWGVVVPSSLTDDDPLRRIRLALSAAKIEFISTTLPRTHGLSITDAGSVAPSVAQIYVGPMKRY